MFDDHHLGPIRNSWHLLNSWHISRRGSAAPRRVNQSNGRVVVQPVRQTFRKVPAGGRKPSLRSWDSFPQMGKPTRLMISRNSELKWWFGNVLNNGTKNWEQFTNGIVWLATWWVDTASSSLVKTCKKDPSWSILVGPTIILYYTNYAKNMMGII